MNARSATHSQPASFDSGRTDRRLATIAKIVRSTAWASSRRPPAALMIVWPISSRSHSRSASHEDPIDRDSMMLTSPDAVAATASAGSRKRLIERTSRASASRST